MLFVICYLLFVICYLLFLLGANINFEVNNFKLQLRELKIEYNSMKLNLKWNNLIGFKVRIISFFFELGVFKTFIWEMKYIIFILGKYYLLNYN